MGRGETKARSAVPARRRKQKELTTTTDASSSLLVDKTEGQLSLFLSMPLDVFFEVASHLKPLDILHLARVSSTFQQMLLSRSSRRIWVVARKNVVPEMPDGPGDLNEPLYTRLVFERQCMKCGTPEADQVDYANFHRYCNSCWCHSVQPGGKHIYDSGFYYDTHFKKVVYELLPGVPGTSGANRDVGHTEVARINSKQTEHTLFHRDDFVALAEQYRQVRAGETDMSVEQFVAEHRARTQARLLFQTEILMVEYDRRLARAMYQHQKNDRKLAIEEKLRELDYEPEDYPATDAKFHSLLNQGAPLTPRIWNNIKPKFLAMLQVERTRRVEDAFCTKWFMRMQELKPFYEQFTRTFKERVLEDVWARTTPAFEAAVKLPSMVALLTSAAPSEHVTGREFAAIRSALLRDIREAMVKVQHHCANVLREAGAVGRPPSASTSSTRTDQGESVSKSKGKAHDLSGETTEPDIDTDDLFADDSAAADRALLERPTSLFECAHTRCHQGQLPGTSSVMTFLGVLLHDATFHTSPSWDCIPVRAAAEGMRELMPRLLDSVGLPRGTALSVLHERLVNEMPGQCSCGVVFNQAQQVIIPVTDESLDLTHLLQHISGWHPGIPWHPGFGVPPYLAFNQPGSGTITAHNITFQTQHHHIPGWHPGFGAAHYLNFNQPGSGTTTAHNITFHPRLTIAALAAQGGPQMPPLLPRTVDMGMGYNPLGIMLMAQFMSSEEFRRRTARRQIGASSTASAPGPVVVGPTHPLVQMHMQAVAGMLNQSEGYAKSFARANNPGPKKRR